MAKRAAYLRDLFFFQAEDGIRDGHVTGFQTCALPIYSDIHRLPESEERGVHRTEGRRMAAGDDSRVRAAEGDLGIPSHHESGGTRSQVGRGQSARWRGDRKSVV